MWPSSDVFKRMLRNKQDKANNLHYTDTVVATWYIVLILLTITGRKNTCTGYCRYVHKQRELIDSFDSNETTGGLLSQSRLNEMTQLEITVGH